MKTSPDSDIHIHECILPARRGMALRMIVLFFVIIMAGAGGVYALRPGGGSTTASAGDTYQVARQSFDIVITSNGELKAAQQIELRNETEREGVITYIIPEGQFVEPDTVLVEFNREQLKRELDDAEDQLESTRNDLTSAKAALEIQKSENDSALRKAELVLRLAELELKKWQEGDLVAKRQELALRVETTQRDYERLKRKYEQAIKLKEQDYISSDELEQDQIRYLEAENASKTAKLNQDIFEKYEYPKLLESKTSAVEDAKAEIERVKQRNSSQLAQREADLAKREAQLKYRQERADKLQHQLDACSIKAPSAGMVVYSTSIDRGMRWGGDDGPWQIGSRVGPRQSVIILPDTSQMIAEVKVHESLTSQIKPGQKATVSVDAVGHEPFDAEVESIGVLAENGGWRDPNRREYTVRLLLKNTQSTVLKPSMRCESKILLQKVNDALAVPLQAVFNDAGRTYCYVASGGQYIKTRVRTGRFSENWIEILDGLQEGQTVLLREPKPSEIKKVNQDKGDKPDAAENKDNMPRKPMMKSNRPTKPAGQGGKMNSSSSSKPSGKP